MLLSLITLFTCKCCLAGFKAAQANNFFVGFSDFLNQQEKFAISATSVTKLTLAVKAAFIHKILCVEVFKILFGQLVDKMLENNSLHEHEAPPLTGECASGA